MRGDYGLATTKLQSHRLTELLQWSLSLRASVKYQVNKSDGILAMGHEEFDRQVNQITACETQANELV
ncbi:hypothetical protein ACDY97_22615 [Rhizobium mongolense]